jgi:hypothetical protein
LTGSRLGIAVKWFYLHCAGVSSRAASLSGLAVFVTAIVGCGGKADVPVGDAAENIRKLALAYVQYASAHGGVGPADEETLAKAVAASEGISAEEAKKRFTSIRDNKPYVIRWKQRPIAPATGPDMPKANLLIYEQDGAEGTRYTADGRLSIKELSNELLSQQYPEFENPAG